MKYRILKTFRGSPNGLSCVEYKGGTECELNPALAQVAIAEKWAEPINVKSHTDAPDNKAMGKAPENKASAKR